ncbi:MAG: RDD family protein [Dehalococcoidia bacterium]|nr:RDD family protein [Dehalococcoidia bacterium]
MAPTRDVQDGLASGWRRLGGHIIDNVLLSIALGIGAAIGEELIGGGLWLVWFLVVARRGQSPGKQIVNTRVVHADGRPSGLFRTFVRRELLLVVLLTALELTLGTAGVVLCFLIFALGGLWCLIDVNHQCLWDKIAGTYVVAIEQYERMLAFESTAPPDATTRVATLGVLRDQGLISDKEYEERAREIEGR